MVVKKKKKNFNVLSKYEIEIKKILIKNSQYITENIHKEEITKIVLLNLIL